MQADSQEVYEYDHTNLSSNVRAGEWITLKDVIPRTRDGHYQDSRGHTLLHLAAVLGHQKTAEVLIEMCGVYPGVLTHRGQTADELARQNGHFQVAEALIQARKRDEVCCGHVVCPEAKVKDLETHVCHLSRITTAGLKLMRLLDRKDARRAVRRAAKCNQHRG